MPILLFDPMDSTPPKGALQCESSDRGAFHLQYLPPILSGVRAIDSARTDDPTRYRTRVSI